MHEHRRLVAMARPSSLGPRLTRPSAWLPRAILLAILSCTAGPQNAAAVTAVTDWEPGFATFYGASCTSSGILGLTCHLVLRAACLPRVWPMARPQSNRVMVQRLSFELPCRHGV